MIRAALASALCLTGGSALAHDWYPFECCSKNDCAPATRGQVRSVPGGGFQIGGEIIRPGDPRIRPIPPDAKNEDGSPASGVHVCIPPGRPVRCIFVGGVDG